MLANFAEANKAESTAHFYAVVIRQSIAKDILERKVCKSIEVSTKVTQRSPFSALFLCEITLAFNLKSIASALFWLPTYRLTERFLTSRYMPGIIKEMDRAFKRSIKRGRLAGLFLAC